MRRRDLFKRLGVLAAAVAVVPAAKAEAAPSEDDQIRALVDDVMANPDKHPEIMARVRELTGDARAEGYRRGYDVATARAESRAMQPVPAAAQHVAQKVDRMLFSDGTRMWSDAELAWVPLTFEAMQADCAARGCILAPQPVRSDEDERIIAHLHAGQGLRTYDYSTDSQENVPARVDAWRRSLHEQGDTGYYMVPDAPMPAEAFFDGFPAYKIASPAPGSIRVVHGRNVLLT